MTTRRNSMRYPGYDYRQAGATFVTVCTHQRQALFGSIRNDTTVLSSQGAVAERLWLDIAGRFQGVIVDTYIVMPDHVHGILFLGAKPELERNASVGDIIHWFKIKVQAAYRKEVARGTWSPYQGKLWQRDYHDRIIRSDRELDQIRDYILANPARWTEKRDAT